MCAPELNISYRRRKRGTYIFINPSIREQIRKAIHLSRVWHVRTVHTAYETSITGKKSKKKDRHHSGPQETNKQEPQVEKNSGKL